MIWLYRIISYLIIAIIAFVIFSFIFKKTIKTENTKVISLATLFACLVMIVIAKPFIEPRLYAWTFESAIRHKYPIIEMLAQTSPDEFKAYVSKEKNEIIKSGSTKNNLISFYTIEFLDSQVAKYSQIATNQSLYNFMQSRLNLFKMLIDTNPELILRLEFPRKFVDGNNMQSEKLNEFYDKNMQNAENVIKSAIDTPQTPPTEQDSKKAVTILRSIATGLTKKFGKDNVILTFQDPTSLSLDKTTAAKILIALYEDIITTGVNDTGTVVKYVFRSGEAK